MGISFSGGMFVGARVSDFPEGIPEGFSDIYDYFIDYLADEKGLDSYSPWFDADIEECLVGFTVENVPVEEMNEEWLKNIKNIAEKFFEITGVKPSLIGSQNIT